MIIANKDHDVNFGRDPISTMTPNKISTIQIPAASKKDKGIRNSILRTPEEKYSSNLYENPRASLAFTNPEIINKIPTKNLEISVKICMLF